MKQHAGDEIVTIMAGMPGERVAALRDAHPEHRFTEREARWWGYLQFARTGAYDGEAFTVTVNGTGEQHTQAFVSYTLQGRASDDRVGLVRAPWPDLSVAFTGARQAG